MADVTLSASVRASLLSLQNTTNLVERTQGRLSTGLRVASAIDDPVSFFQAKSLSDRATDLLEKKDGIDQGISTVTAALDGVEGIEALVAQMKGISNSMKSATSAQIGDLITQFNDLRTQINNLATDATYQGTNLVNGVGQTLSVEFSEKTASLLTVNSVDLRAGTAGLSITSAAAYTGGFPVQNGTINAVSYTAAVRNIGNQFLALSSDFTVTFQGPTQTFTAGETVAFTYGTGSTYNLTVATSAPLTVTNGQALDVSIVSAASGITAGAEFALQATQSRNFSIAYTSVGTAVASVSAAEAVTFTYRGDTAITLTTADGPINFTYGTASLQFRVASGQTLVLLQNGDTFAANFMTAAAGVTAGLSGVTAAGYFINTAGAVAITGATAALTGTALTRGIKIAGSTGAITADTNVERFVREGDTSTINSMISELDSALVTLRTNAQTLGSNVALLNTRLDFTEQYVSTLQTGADKLTLADINEEGANLLALQTRQQLGIQSLSLAAQAEASILQLFG